MSEENSEAVSVEATEVTTETTEVVEAQDGSNGMDVSPSEETLNLLEDTIYKESNALTLTPKEDVKVEEVEVKEGARFSKEFTRLSKREKELSLREKELKESSTAVDNLNVAAGTFKEDPVNFIKSQLSAFTGSDDPEVIEGAFGDLYEALTMHVLGADAPKEMLEQSQYSKLQKEFDAFKASQVSERQKLEADALASQQNATITRAQSTIQSQLSESKESYPYLMAQQEESPGELVFEVVWADYNKQIQKNIPNPKQITIEAAAEQANAYYKEVASPAWAKSLTSVTTTTTPPTGQPANNRPGNSRTLNNNNASVAPTVEGSSYIDDDEESKLKAMELLFT